MQTLRHRLGYWLPDRANALVLVGAICLATLAWLYAMETRTSLHESLATTLFAGVISIVLGVAFGSFGALIYLLGRALLQLFGKAFSLSAARSIRVAATFYVPHLAAVVLLFSLGAWRQPWPVWQGVVPFLWQ